MNHLPPLTPAVGRAEVISNSWPSSTVLGAGASVGLWACTTKSQESFPKNFEASMMPLVSQTPAPTEGGLAGGLRTVPGGLSSTTRLAA